MTIIVLGGERPHTKLSESAAKSRKEAEVIVTNKQKLLCLDLTNY